MNRRRLIYALILAVAFVSGVIVCLPGISRLIRPRHSHAIPPLYQNLRILKNAIGQYGIEFGEFPARSPEEIASALLGKNPKQLRVLTRTNALVDPFGTPYRITIVGRSVEVRSAGPNRTFGDADDVVMERDQ